MKLVTDYNTADGMVELRIMVPQDLAYPSPHHHTPTDSPGWVALIEDGYRYRRLMRQVLPTPIREGE